MSRRNRTLTRSTASAAVEVAAGLCVTLEHQNLLRASITEALSSDEPEARVKRSVAAAQTSIARSTRVADHVHFSTDTPTMCVVGYSRFKHDVVIRYTPLHASDHEITKRGHVTEWSSASRAELRHLVVNSETRALGMFTLTYPADFPVNGLLSKKHLDNLFRELRRRWGERFLYLWFLEFQSRGAPHYHVLTAGSIHDELKKRVVHARGCKGSCGVTAKFPWGKGGLAQRDKSKRWNQRCRVVFRGDEESFLADAWLQSIGAADDEAARRFNHGGIWEPWHEADGCARYVAKETTKMWQKKVPQGFASVGRFWGASKAWDRPECHEEFFGSMAQVRNRLGLDDSAILYPTIYSGSKPIDKPRLL